MGFLGFASPCILLNGTFLSASEYDASRWFSRSSFPKFRAPDRGRSNKPLPDLPRSSPIPTEALRPQRSISTLSSYHISHRPYISLSSAALNLFREAFFRALNQHLSSSLSASLLRTVDFLPLTATKFTQALRIHNLTEYI